MDFLIAAISLGFLGSFHCIGMCGPIAMSLPVHNKPPLLKYILILSYNFGRIITYSLMGFLAGSVGKSFMIAGLQQALSVTIGILLLIYVFVPFKNSFSGYSFFMWIKTTLARVFSIGKGSSLFLVGILNGLLPCGLVYIGIAGAIATGDLLKGFLFMAAFGVGTLPMMILLPFVGGLITVSTRSKMLKVIPVMITVMALFLILRGMNLGIPYVSPKISTTKEGVSCHQAGPEKPKLLYCRKPKH